MQRFIKVGVDAHQPAEFTPRSSGAAMSPHFGLSAAPGRAVAVGPADSKVPFFTQCVLRFLPSRDQKKLLLALRHCITNQNDRDHNSELLAPSS